MQDPVNTAAGKPELNDDDQIAMMAGDAGVQAPSGTAAARRDGANNGQEITIVDPTVVARWERARRSYIYLFLQPGGSSFNAANGYVQMARGAAPTSGSTATPSPPRARRSSASATRATGPTSPATSASPLADNDANPHITDRQRAAPRARPTGSRATP